MNDSVVANQSEENNGVDPEPNEPFQLGPMVRAARQRMGWTLETTAAETGVGRSTLSKIENGQTSPGFEIVQKLAAKLELDLPQLFLPARSGARLGRRDVTRKGQGRKRSTATYDHELLCTEMVDKGMLPYLSRIKARSFADFDDWIRHEGEEFLLVIDGAIELHTEFYRPLPLAAGDSVYYDSGMGHACVSTGKDDALVLWVSLENSPA